MKKLLLLLLVVLFFGCSIEYEKTNKLAGYVISINEDETVTFCGLEKKWINSSSFYIPPDIGGRKVTNIGYDSSATWDGCSSIYIPTTVNTINSNSFRNNASNLSKIYWDKNGVSPFAKMFLPNGVTLYAKSNGNYVNVTKGTENISISILGMVYVQGDTFQMGSELGNNYERPVHNVTVNSFYICDHEVTKSEYEAILESNFIVDDTPKYLCWYDAIKYCNILSQKEKLTPCYKLNGNTDIDCWGAKGPEWDNVICDWNADGYRLPTEAEWEYAARGGNKSNGYRYSGNNTLDEVAWYKDNSGDAVHNVKAKQPNELDLYDMSGNMWEWCWDWARNYDSDDLTNPCGPSTGTYRIVRGGSKYSYACDCLTSRRNYALPIEIFRGVGFRVVRNSNYLIEEML